MHRRHYRFTLILSALLVGAAAGPARAQGPDRSSVSADIRAIFDKPMYHGAIWGLRVVDVETGRAIINLEPHHHFYVASVRKIFTVAELLNQVGPAHTYNTPVYRRGAVTRERMLQGDLILVASGDLTMGGRTNPDGSIALGDFDHNEANGLGNAILSKPDPLAGYAALARQIVASGIKEVTGEIVIDDRLFEPFEFRDEKFKVGPIFVNDDMVDLSIRPATLGNLASVDHRPESAALRVDSELVMTRARTELKIVLEQPACIGTPGCTAALRGGLPTDHVPILTGTYPLIRTFRIADPASFARTVLIEVLRAAGVRVKAPAVEPNPTRLLPKKDSYDPATRVAELIGLPYAQDAKLVNKVSYNIGADTSLILYGLTQGVHDMKSALVVEKKNLRENYGIKPDEYLFFDGSGGGEATATNQAVTHMLGEMRTRPAFPDYFASFPILGVDGSLATVTAFESDPTLAPAKGQVRAKTGTYLGQTSEGDRIKCQAFAGYFQAKSGKKFAYQLVVNNVPFKSISDVIQVFQDEGKISAILWRDN